MEDAVAGWGSSHAKHFAPESGFEIEHVGHVHSSFFTTAFCIPAAAQLNPPTAGAGVESEAEDAFAAG